MTADLSLSRVVNVTFRFIISTKDGLSSCFIINEFNGMNYLKNGKRVCIRFLKIDAVLV